MSVVGLYNYWMVIVLLMLGLYVLMAERNLVKKIIGLNIFQVAVIMFYITIGKIRGGTAPIYVDDPTAAYSSPVPHVLMLTAIVVGIATTALALALVVRIHEEFDSIEEDEIQAMEGGG